MAWIPAIASIAGSALSFMGNDRSNDANQSIQQMNSAFNAEQAGANRQFQHEQAQNQMNFQEKMANTTWRRGVEDMIGAGLNPMLAYSQGGNPAPSGAAGGGSAASAGMPGNQINAWASAGNAAGTWAQIENTMADTKKKEEEAELTRRQHLGYTGEQEVRVDKMKKEAEKVVQDTNLSVEQRKKVMAEVVQVLAHTQNLDADTALKKVNEILQKHDVPRMKAEAAYFESTVGKSSPHNKYGPQTPFRLLEGLGERIINKFSARTPNNNPDYRDREDNIPAGYGGHTGQHHSGRIQR